MHRDQVPNPCLTSSNRRLIVLLAIILLLSLVLRVGVALRFRNIYWPDEIYQSLEPAHHFAFGTGITSWEFRIGARSCLFPIFLAGVMRATAWLGSGSDGYLLGVTVVLSLISLTAVWFGFEWSYRVSGINAAIVSGFASAFWYELIYFAPKAFNEVLAGHLLLPGLYLGTCGQERPSGRTWRLFLAGVFFGLAVGLRMQLAPAVLLGAAYLCWKNPRKNLLPVAGGICLSVLVFGLVDAVTWSYPFHSYLTMLHFQITARSRFGAQPWHYFLVQILSYYWPVIPFAFVGARRSPFLGWMVLAIVIPHTLIPHKEWRFIYPATPLLITLSGIGVAETVSALNARLKLRWSAFAVVGLSVGFFLCTSAAIAAVFPYWKQYAGNLLAFQKLTRDDNVCGVALYKNSWVWSGGYTYLHRNVPIYLLTEELEVEKLAPSFNVIVTYKPLPEEHDSFGVVHCWDSRSYGGSHVPILVCLYKRLGRCAPGDSEHEVNETLKRLGQ